MPIKDCNGDVIGVAQVINKLGGESQFTAQDEKVFAGYLQFCGIGLRNAQLYEKSQLEVKRNQVSKWNIDTNFVKLLTIPLIIDIFISSFFILSFQRRVNFQFYSFFPSHSTGSFRPSQDDFRRTEHNRAYGIQDFDPYAILDTVSTSTGNHFTRHIRNGISGNEKKL